MALLDLLLRKDNRSYISFYNALVKETYNDLASLLHDDLPQTSPDAHKSSYVSFTPCGEEGQSWVFSPVERMEGLEVVLSASRREKYHGCVCYFG